MRRSFLPSPEQDRLQPESRPASGAPQAESETQGPAQEGLPRFLAEEALTTQAESEPVVDPGADDTGAALQSELEEESVVTTDTGPLPNPEREEVGPNPAAVPEVSGQGQPVHTTAYGVTLSGRTDADYDGGSFRTRNVRVRAGTGCEGCAGADCIRATGVLESTFRVTTTVTLPSVDDFPNLTPCQRQRVQNAITNVLAPHEQEHVRAFRQYNGTVRTPFDLTLCREEFDARIQALHESVETTRRAAAQGASDALDPFQFNVDLDCQD